MVLDRVADLHVPLIAPLVSLTRLSCARLVLVTPAIPITIGPIAIAVITIWPVTIAVIRVGWGRHSRGSHNHNKGNNHGDRHVDTVVANRQPFQRVYSLWLEAL